MGRHLAARMYPDHDWLESDFISAEMLLDEGPCRVLSYEEIEQRNFERTYEKFLRLPEVQAMDQVAALRIFLDKYPHWKCPA